MTNKIRKFGWFAALFSAVILMNFTFTSCGDDEELDSYIVECTQIKCADFDATELAQMQANMNYALADVVLSNVTKDYAVAQFDAAMQDLANDEEFKDGWDFLDNPYEMTFVLKNSNNKQIKKATVVVDQTSCKVK